MRQWFLLGTFLSEELINWSANSQLLRNKFRCFSSPTLEHCVKWKPQRWLSLFFLEEIHSKLLLFFQGEKYIWDTSRGPRLDELDDVCSLIGRPLKNYGGAVTNLTGAHLTSSSGQPRAHKKCFREPLCFFWGLLSRNDHHKNGECCCSSAYLEPPTTKNFGAPRKQSAADRIICCCNPSD